MQSRGVRCADPTGCASHRAPEATQTCSMRKQCDSQWFTSQLIYNFLLCNSFLTFPLLFNAGIDFL